MEIVIERPPNFESIAEIFPFVRETKGILYCWENKICNPDNVEVPECLLRHEEVHCGQQERIGGPEKWWDRYLKEPEFRFENELLAHQVEYKTAILSIKDKNQRNMYLMMTARRLSGTFYGNMCSYPTAIKLIKGV